MNKNLCLNNSEKEWLLKVRSTLSSRGGKKIKIPTNEIWYTSINEEILTPRDNSYGNINIISNTYEKGKGVIKFDSEVTTIGDGNNSFFPELNKLTTISFPGTVNNVKKNAFFSNNSDRSGLKIVIFNNRKKSLEIGQGAFANCFELKTVDFGDGDLTIGNGAFAGCALTTLNFPKSVNSIGQTAFSVCTSLTTLNISGSVGSIGTYAFEGCTRLTTITISGSVESIGRNEFDGCKGLTALNISGSVGSIGISAFDSCTGLTTINITGSVRSIGAAVFYACTSLTSITIPDSVTSIGGMAFSGCTGLTSITSLKTTPPTLGTQSFDNTNNSPIYVPSESVETYKTTTNWSTYADRIQAIQ